MMQDLEFHACSNSRACFPAMPDLNCIALQDIWYSIPLHTTTRSADIIRTIQSDRAGFSSLRCSRIHCAHVAQDAVVRAQLPYRAHLPSCQTYWMCIWAWCSTQRSYGIWCVRHHTVVSESDTSAVCCSMMVMSAYAQAPLGTPWAHNGMHQYYCTDRTCLTIAILNDHSVRPYVVSNYPKLYVVIWFWGIPL